MKANVFGEVVYTEDEMIDVLYQNPNLDIANFIISEPATFNNAAKHFHVKLSVAYSKVYKDDSVESWDRRHQAEWHMPNEYKEMDIALWCLEQCKTDAEKQRVGEELILFQERNLFPLLKFLKYFIDTLRKNKIVWGVGRGSSVSSYVLYLLGVHRINSMYYELDIREFLK